MKLSTIAITVTLSVASVQAFAQNVILKPVDNNLETKVCLTAATEGYLAAKKLARESGADFNDLSVSVSCNGLPVSQFAKTYSNETVIDDSLLSEVADD